MAVDANYFTLKNSICLENAKGKNIENYYNIIAVKAKDKDNPTLKKLIQVYQSKETKKLIYLYFKYNLDGKRIL